MPSTELPVLSQTGAPPMTESPTLSLQERMAICRVVPKTDWNRFRGSKFVAIQIDEKRILDAGNDPDELRARVAAQRPIDSFFTAPTPRTKTRDRSR
jgi:hypothetical protein